MWSFLKRCDFITASILRNRVMACELLNLGDSTYEFITNLIHVYSLFTFIIYFHYTHSFVHQFFIVWNINIMNIHLHTCQSYFSEMESLSISWSIYKSSEFLSSYTVFHILDISSFTHLYNWMLSLIQFPVLQKILQHICMYILGTTVRYTSIT